MTEYDRTPRPRSSPWGAVQDATELADGVWFVHTASHGGIHLSSQRNRRIPARFRSAAGWYEEDCEWSIAALANPDAFPKHQDEARRTAMDWEPDAFEAITGERIPSGGSFKRDEAAFYQEHAEDWLAVAASGDWADWVPSGMVGVTAVQGGRERDPHLIRQRVFFVPVAEYQARGRFAFVIDPARHQERETA